MIDRELSVASDLAVCSLQQAIGELGDGGIPERLDVHAYDRNLASMLLWQLGWRMAVIHVNHSYAEGEWRLYDMTHGRSIHSPGA